MEPLNFRLDSAHQVHDFFRGFRPHPPTGWWFRGQANTEWDLIPKAGRRPYFLKGGRSLGRFASWSKKAIAFDRNLPTNDWERLAVAQHYGLATCLLDWTYNPLIALFFACVDHAHTDGAVYFLEPEAHLNSESALLEDENMPVVGYAPRHIDPRVQHQRSAFTVHLPAHKKIEAVQHPALDKSHPILVKLEVPSTFKTEIMANLDNYGVSHSSIFPDLGGLSSHVNWETERISKSKESAKAFGWDALNS
ncbi:MAG: FRG domain-containing protein [Pseudomonadota bacterium]